MSKLAQWEMQKAKLRMNAAMTKPERPRFGEEVGLNKALFDMQTQMPNENKATVGLLDELQGNWDKGRKGGAGDALIAGIKAGINRKSLLEDKERAQKVTGAMEKLKGMVEDTNRQLWEQEKLANAKQAIAPRVMAFLEQSKQMDANARNVYLQRAMDEYNQKAGTDYKILSSDGAEPWKVTVSDGQESQFIDLMDFIKTPEEQKLQYYLKSNEVQNAERMMAQEDALNRNAKQSSIGLHNAQAQKYQMQVDKQQALQQRREQLQQSGQLPQGAIFFDEIQEPAELKARIEDLKNEKEKLQPTEAGIKALDEMDNIFKKYPKLSTSLAKWANSKEDTLIGNFLKDVVNKDERNALLQLEKHAATLALGTIQQFKGQRPTDILKKLIKDTNPGSNFTYEAFVPIKNQYMQQFETQKAKSQEAMKGWNNRYFPAYESTYPTQGETSNSEQGVVNKLQALDPSLTPEMILEAQRRLNGGQ